MRLKHFLSVFLTLLTLSVGQMWGTAIEITYTSLGVSGNSYTSNSHSFTNVATINWTNACVNGQKLRLKASGELWNSTEMPANIDSIVMEGVSYSSNSSAGFYLYGATTAKTSSGTNYTKLYDNSGTGKIKIDFTGHSYKYFYIKNKSSRTLDESSIKVYYTTGTSYAVTYNNGGHGTAPSNTTASNITLSAITSVTGYICTGWKANQAVKVNNNTVAANTLIENGTSVTLTAATTFTAQWENAEYTISSTLTQCSSSPAIPTKYTYTGNAANLSYTISANSGYTLPSEISLTMGGEAMTLGSDYTWDSSNGALNISKVITSNVAISISAGYKVRWFVGTTPTKTDVVTSGSSSTPPAVSDGALGGSCSSSVFKGWTGSQINGTSNDAPADLFTAAPTITTEKNYYAVFAEETISGSSAPANITITLTSSFTAGDKITSGIFSATIAQGNGTNPPVWHIGDAAVRSYAGNSCILASTGAALKDVTFTGTMSKGYNVPSGEGSYSSSKWTAPNTSTTSVTLTVPSGSGNNKIQTITASFQGSQTINYSDYRTSCCQPLAQINGSVLRTHF